MPEEHDEEAATPFDFERYRDVVRRRHMIFLVVLLAGWGVVWGLSWLLPERYESSTLILVAQSTLPKDYFVPNVSDTLQDRLGSITQQILSRTRLLLIADKFHLYAASGETLTPEAKVEQMRKDIKIQLVRDAQSGAITAFRVSYSAPNRYTAQQVTKELTNLFIDENLRVRQRQSREATRFLQEQVAIARSALAGQDAKVRAFRAAHEGTLPSQEGSNLQIMSGLQAQLQAEQGLLSAAKQQRASHEAMIEQYRAAQKTAQTGVSTGDALGAIDQQLLTLRSRLADLSTRYTDQYPEVQSVKAEIAKTEEMRRQAVVEMQQDSSTSNIQSEAQAQNSAAHAASGPLRQLGRQLQGDQNDIANHEQTIQRLEARINNYQGRLSVAPVVEQQLGELTRRYEQSQSIYNDLLKKENDSQMATSMEQMQEGDRFTIIDPPSLPQKPVYPQRLHISAAGFGVGLGLSILLVTLLELLDDRLHSDKDIAKVLPISVLCEIPEVLSPAEEQQRRNRVFAGWTMAVAVTVIILAGTAFSYLYYLYV